MTREELIEKLQKVECRLDDINYLGIQEIFERNNWMWSTLKDPDYFPQRRDIRRFVHKAFRAMRDGMLSADFSDYDYETQHYNVSSGRLSCSLFWEETLDGWELRFELNLDTSLAVIDCCLTNYIDNSGYERDLTED